MRFLSGLLLMVVLGSASAADPKLRVLIIDGQNNHNWKATTPYLKKYLEDCGRFTVTVATSPEKGKKAEMANFHPNLSTTDVVVSNYNGEAWSKELNDALESRVKDGKLGLVIVHAANNAFGPWKEFYKMIGMGWQDAKFGKRPYLDAVGEQKLDEPGQGQGAGHRYTGQFTVTVRDPEHPVTKGMPKEWMHNNDELYDNMRGPIENVKLLATAYSKGTMKHEPMIWTVSYGKGRIFHTPMGHDVNSMKCVGFASTLQRGTEWATTGAVTIPLPENFPTAEKVSLYPEKK
ncbi:ThuA domain-containing protein [Limnoglobus roseus]|uniref:ThuA domain-containing protein n=1 Tax=Limnoglobus roseus TaxID=2598579 RepID=A0A5C1AH52_9BACT|nr:ThuA domain-containing protein [Limnoglobus roseus]QEL17072.1 ThuA domain-containing protein [Limnoglobus roseus]